MGKRGDSDEEGVDRRQMDNVAEDAINLFRANLFMIGIYVSVIAILTRTGDGSEFSKIIASRYTQIGLLFWAGSAGIAIIAYRGARLLATAHLRDNPGEITGTYSQISMARNVSSAALGSLISVIGLIVGVDDGMSQAAVQPHVPAFLTIFAIVAVVAVQFILKLANSVLGNIDRILNRLIIYVNTVLGSFIKWQVKVFRDLISNIRMWLDMSASITERIVGLLPKAFNLINQMILRLVNFIQSLFQVLKRYFK